MKLASHDTMSYLKPRKWWMRPFHFIGRCQSLTLEEQYAYGVRMFDVRIKWRKDLELFEFAHGDMPFTGLTPLEAFDWLSKQGEDVMINLVLEYNRKPKHEDIIVKMFIEFAKTMIVLFPSLKFFGMRMKYSWKELYTYPDMPYPSIYQASSSTTGGWWDDWWPWLYAKLHNKDNLIQGTVSDWLSIDFIGMT